MSQKPITFADEIDFFEGFNCRPKNMFEALTDEKMVSGYTFGPAKIEAKEGGAFSMFGGTVEGTFVSLEEGKIVQKWRFNTWPLEHYSDVTITLTEPERGVTRMQVVHKRIPEEDRYGHHSQREKVLEGWQKYFCHNIHKFVGYGKHTFDEDSDF